MTEYNISIVELLLNHGGSVHERDDVIFFLFFFFLFGLLKFYIL